MRPKTEIVRVVIGDETAYISFEGRWDAQEQVDEFNELARSGLLPQEFTWEGFQNAGLRMSAEIIDTEPHFDRLVDRVADGAKLGDRLEKLGYVREGGEWFLRDAAGHAVVYELTLTEAVRHAQARGVWED